MIYRANQCKVYYKRISTYHVSVVKCGSKDWWRFISKDAAAVVDMAIEHLMGMTEKHGKSLKSKSKGGLAINCTFTYDELYVLNELLLNQEHGCYARIKDKLWMYLNRSINKMRRKDG